MMKYYLTVSWTSIYSYQLCERYIKNSYIIILAQKQQLQLPVQQTDQRKTLVSEK